MFTVAFTHFYRKKGSKLKKRKQDVIEILIWTPCESEIKFEFNVIIMTIIIFRKRLPKYPFCWRKESTQVFCVLE